MECNIKETYTKWNFIYTQFSYLFPHLKNNKKIQFNTFPDI